MRTAPIGAFGAMAATIGSFGVGTLAQLIKLIVTFYADVGGVRVLSCWAPSRGGTASASGG